MNPLFKSFDQEKLKRLLEIKERYDSGMLSLEEARNQMRDKVGKVSPQEFAAAEQMLKEEHPDECRDENVMTMLDLFEGMESLSPEELASDHSISAYLYENKQLKETLQKGREMLDQPFIKNQWLELMEDILSFKVHYQRKQNQLYAALERKGFTRPSTTMWTYDDYNRDLMNKAMQLLERDLFDEFKTAYKTMSDSLEDLIQKEELILYPTSLSLIPDEEFEQMRDGDLEIGFYKQAGESYQTKSNENSQSALTRDLLAVLSKHNVLGSNPRALLHVAEGELSLEQINLLYKHMPVDFSYVDEKELVRFYSDTKHRIFPRSKGVIGRQVKHCHPPKSVHIVEEIIEKFRSGEKDRIDFWINKPDLFIYILYVAVRDEKGNFRGVLEMMQDCTRIRRLEGSRTLLVWESDQKTREAHKEEPSNESSPISDELTPKTKLADLLSRYPALEDALIAKYPSLKLLKTPMAKVMLPIATLERISKRANIPYNELVATVTDIIKK